MSEWQPARLKLEHSPHDPDNGKIVHVKLGDAKFYNGTIRKACIASGGRVFQVREHPQWGCVCEHEILTD